MHPPANCWHCSCNNYIVSGHSGIILLGATDNNTILYFHHNVYKQFTIIIFITIWISHLTHPWKKEVIRRIYHHLTRFFHSMYDHWVTESLVSGPKGRCIQHLISLTRLKLCTWSMNVYTWGWGQYVCIMFSVICSCMHVPVDLSPQQTPQCH